MKTAIIKETLRKETVKEAEKCFFDLTENIVPLNSNSNEALPIAAVDSSFVTLGQDSENYYILLRSALVFRNGQAKIRISRSGPFLLKSESLESSFHGIEIDAISNVNEVLSNGIILLDGIDLKEIENKLKNFHRNIFISIDKVFQFENIKISSVFPSYPFLVKLSDNSFLARLSANGFIIKLRLSKHDDVACKVLSVLTKSDELPFGYPLTLKLAHVFAKILPYEASSARLSLYFKEKINITKKLDGRKLLLGSLWG
jgi:hypothetical protein